MAVPERIRSNTGITLIEIMVSLGILTLAGIVLLTLTSGALQSWSCGSSQAYSESGASLAVQKLAREVRDGATAGLESGGAVLVVNFPSITTDPTTGETIYDQSGVGETRRYLVSSGNLIRRLNGVDTILVRNVRPYPYTYFSATLGIVGATITVREQVGKVTQDRTYNISISLRNYRST